MQQRKYLKNWKLILLLPLIISGCSLIPKEVQVQTKFVERTIPIQGHPKGVTLYPVNFYAVTAENFEEFQTKFEKEYGDFVFFAISVPDYENLSLNMGEMKRYIDQQKTIIVYYEKSINNEYKAQIQLEKE